jgi:hypothetical protein
LTNAEGIDEESDSEDEEGSALLYCFLLVIYLSAILISFSTYAVLAGPYGCKFL